MIEPDEEVLETLDGWIDHVEDDVAYFTLTSRTNGDVLVGSYPMEEFTALGVEDGFVVKTVGRGEWTRVEIEPRPDVEPTTEDVKTITDKIHQVLPPEDPGVAY